jgi:hypothetical protein
VFSLYFFAPREPSALVARERCLPRWFFSPSSSPVSCSPCGSRHRFSIRGASRSLAAAHSQGPAASSCLSIHFSVPRSVLRYVCCLWFGLCYCRLDFSLRPQILAHSSSWCPESLPSSFHFAHEIFISCERVSAVDPSLVVFLIFPHVGVLSFGLHRSSDSAAVPSPHAWFVHRLSFLRAGVDPASSCPASIL